MKKIKHVLTFVIFFLTLYTEGVAQVAINTDGSPPSANTILDLNPSVGKAFMPPSMTWAQIKAISPAKAGMVVYDSEFNSLRMYDGTRWVNVGEQKLVSDPPGSFKTQTANGVGIFPSSVITDASGNVYITGTFQQTATFGSLPTITSAGGYDIFIVKYNSSGIPQWVQKAGGLGTNDAGSSIALDVLDNIYIAGRFGGTATFGGLTPITSTGDDDIFIAKYSNSGTAQWVQKAGGTGSDGCNSMVLDGSGNIYMTGKITGTATFGSLTATTSTLDNHYFIAKYNNSGIAQWVQSAYGSFSTESGYKIILGALGSIYVTGYFLGAANFGALPLITATSDQGDIFLAKYANNGTAQWVQRVGVTGTGSYALPSGIVLDALSNIYMTGQFIGTATFGSLTPIASAGQEDIFVAQFNSVGVAQWANRVGGTNRDTGKGIALAASGTDVYVIGSAYSTNSMFDAFSISPLNGSGTRFFAKYDNTGAVKWVKKMAESTNSDVSNITLDASGNVYMVGHFTPTAQFGNQIFTSGSMYLMKYSE
jgi:hypothetical protein